MGLDPGSVGEEPITPRVEMDNKYFWSRIASYALIAASVGLVIYGLIVDVSPSQTSLIESIITLTTVVTVAWLGAANGREAWTGGRIG